MQYKGESVMANGRKIVDTVWLAITVHIGDLNTRKDILSFKNISVIVNKKFKILFSMVGQFFRI